MGMQLASRLLSVAMLLAVTPAPTGSPYVTYKSDPTLTREMVLPNCTGQSLTFNGTALGCISGGGGGGAPTTAQYWTGAADATLSAEKNLGALATGLVLNTGGLPTAYTGTSCTYAIQALDASGAASTCRAAPTIPTDISGEQYWTAAASGNLSAEKNLGAFTGLVLDTAGTPSAYAGTSCAYAIQALDASGAATTCRAAPTIPTDLSAEPFVTKTASASLSNEFALGSLATGILLNTTTTGVPTVYAGTSCSAGQYMNALNASGVKTCAQVAYSQLSGTPIVPTVGGAANDLQINDGLGNLAGYGGTSCAYAVKSLLTDGTSTCTAAPTIPTDVSAASYITKVAEGSLSNEFALGSLGNGLLLNTTTTGVPTIYGGASCTNQFPRSLNASGAPTCASVSLTADVTGIVPLANGGTNKNNAAANGAVVYSDATTFLPSAVGTAGQGLYSGGAGAPTWGDAQKIVRLTADYTNATTTLSNTALTWTSPAAVSRSGFDCTLMVKSSTLTTGGQFDVLVATAPTTITYSLEYVTAAGTAPSTGGTKAFVTSVASATLLGPAAASLTTYTIWQLKGIVVHTSTASAVTVRGKAGAAGTLTVGSGSYCEYYTL